MKLWNKFILWLGLGFYEETDNPIEDFRVNQRKQTDIWTKNKYKSH